MLINNICIQEQPKKYKKKIIKKTSFKEKTEVESNIYYENEAAIEAQEKAGIYSGLSMSLLEEQLKLLLKFNKVKPYMKIKHLFNSPNDVTNFMETISKNNIDPENINKFLSSEKFNEKEYKNIADLIEDIPGSKTPTAENLKETNLENNPVESELKLDINDEDDKDNMKKKIFNFITELKTQLKDRSKNNIIIILDELNQFFNTNEGFSVDWNNRATIP